MPGRAPALPEGRAVANHKQAQAFVTARKGFCYLTAKLYGRHHHMMRVRAYRIEPEEKRRVRQIYPEVAFDWQKIARQLAERREACRRYRTRPRRRAGRGRAWEDEGLLGVYEPGTRTLFTNGLPSSIAGVGRLLDAVLRLDRERAEAPIQPESTRTQAAPDPAVRDGRSTKPR